MAHRRSIQWHTRKLNSAKYKRADTSGEAWHRLIGLQDVVRNDRREVLLALEGSKDALAAAELAERAGVLPQTGIMCALGSGYRPIRSEVEQLRGRWIGLIWDNDVAGIEAAKIVSTTLDYIGVAHARFNWVACQTNEKDLFGWLSSEGYKERLPLTVFFPSLSPSQCSSCSRL